MQSLHQSKHIMQNLRYLPLFQSITDIRQLFYITKLKSIFYNYSIFFKDFTLIFFIPAQKSRGAKAPASYFISV